MEHILLKARAKINIALDVTGKRPDGYHDLRSIMQTLELHDLLFIRKTNTPGIKIISNHSWLPTDERNLIYKAARMMMDRYGIEKGLSFDLTKRIPVSAGLGGGSSDCAAALVGIRKLFGLNLSNRELMELGKNLGADVPYCIMRGTALAEGIGDRLKPLKPHPMVYVVLVKMPFNVSTATVFKRLDLSVIEERPDIDRMLRAVEGGDLKDICSRFSNVLESVTTKTHPEISLIKHSLMESGALGALMSGSGPTVFAYFSDRKTAQNAIRNIRHGDIRVREIFLTKIFNTRSVRI